MSASGGLRAGKLHRVRANILGVIAVVLCCAARAARNGKEWQHQRLADELKRDRLGVELPLTRYDWAAFEQRAFAGMHQRRAVGQLLELGHPGEQRLDLPLGARGSEGAGPSVPASFTRSRSMLASCRHASENSAATVSRC